MIDEVLKIADDVAKSLLLQNFGLAAKDGKEFVPELDEFQYSGVVGVLGVMGDMKGRVIIGVDFNLSTHLVKSVYDQEVATNSDMLDVSCEIFNMIVGNTLVECKKSYNIGLRHTPPSIFLGENMLIVSPRIERKRIENVFEHGKMFIEVGFERGR